MTAPLSRAERERLPETLLRGMREAAMTARSQQMLGFADHLERAGDTILRLLASLDAAEKERDAAVDACSAALDEFEVAEEHHRWHHEQEGRDVEPREERLAVLLRLAEIADA